MNRKTREEVLEEFRCGSIQDAAMRVIARKGIEDTTIQDIADEAGVAKGTIYVYFRDREELLARTADRLFESLLAELEPAFEMNGSLGARLRALAVRQLRFFDEHRALFRATAALSKREEELPKPRSRCLAQYTARLEKLFAGAGDAGELRPGLEPREVAAVYRDCIRGVIVRRLETKSQKTRSAEDDAESIVSILLRGIASGEHR